MPEKTAFETGARKYPARTGPDPSDDFSQDAAGNKQPTKGERLADKADTKKKPARPPDDQEGSPEPHDVKPPPRDTREPPAPNPNGNSD
jgi:hypothetical protein